MRNIALMAGLLLLNGMVARAEVIGTPIEYRAGDTILKGYLAYDAEADTRSWAELQAALKNVYGG